MLSFFVKAITTHTSVPQLTSVMHTPIDKNCGNLSNKSLADVEVTRNVYRDFLTTVEISTS